MGGSLGYHMTSSLPLEIEPYQGIAGVQFGMTAEQVRAILGQPIAPLLEPAPGSATADFFEHLGMEVSYTPSGHCDAIDLAPPSAPTFQGQSLMGQPFVAVKAWFQTLDPEIAIDETGFTSYHYGLGIYAPFAATEPEEPVEGVILFQAGYYD